MVRDSSFRLYSKKGSLNKTWSKIHVMQPNLSASWLFQRAMSAKQQSDVSPDFINELLYVNFQCMQVAYVSNGWSQYHLSSATCASSPFSLSLADEFLFLFCRSWVIRCWDHFFRSFKYFFPLDILISIYWMNSSEKLIFCNQLNLNKNQNADFLLNFFIVSGCHKVWASCQDTRSGNAK